MRTSRVKRVLMDDRGIALITALFIMFAVFMFLFSFQAFTLGEQGFAGLNRNSTMAFSLADGGLHEAIQRMQTPGVIVPSVPSSSAWARWFTNSMATSPGGMGVYVGQTLKAFPAIFPIRSVATFAGAQRATQILVLKTFKNGFGDIVYGPQVQFSGDAQNSGGDIYALATTEFQSWAKAPQCSTSDPPTGAHLSPPEVMSGTTIDLQSGGTSQNTQCPNGDNVAQKTFYNWECKSTYPTYQQEVAPTACGGSSPTDITNRWVGVPFNWHPATPVGMCGSGDACAGGANDFNTVVQQCTGALVSVQNCFTSLGIRVLPATQNSVTVPYTPTTGLKNSYTPSYWSGSTWTTGDVVLIIATKQFCVGSSVTAPTGSPPGCNAGTQRTYGPATGTVRYLDWGIVQDDLQRNAPLTFFEGPNPPITGKQDGIRYVPNLPQLWGKNPTFAQIACAATVFQQATSDGVTGCNGNQITGSGNNTFSGLQANPETLVIDDGGVSGGIGIGGSVKGGTPSSCSDAASFDQGNFGAIIATGDITLGQSGGNMVFSGFIYTPGNIAAQGTVFVRGGIFSANIIGNPSAVTQDTFGTITFCTGQNADLPTSNLFQTLTPFSWLDLPANQINTPPLP